MTSSVDSDQTSRFAAPDQGLHCLFRLACPNTFVKYGIQLSMVNYGGKQSATGEKSNLANTDVALVTKLCKLRARIDKNLIYYNGLL